MIIIIGSFNYFLISNMLSLSRNFVEWFVKVFIMMTPSNGDIFRVTDSLCGEFTGHPWISLTKASDAELCFCLDLRQNKQLSKQSWGWWFAMPSPSLWRHCKACHTGPCVSVNIVRRPGLGRTCPILHCCGEYLRNYRRRHHINCCKLC